MSPAPLTPLRSSRRSVRLSGLTCGKAVALSLASSHPLPHAFHLTLVRSSSSSSSRGRTEGSRAANLEEAIAHHWQSLRVVRSDSDEKCSGPDPR
eukprot:3513706-Rhodomonas_salina.1